MSLRDLINFGHQSNRSANKNRDPFFALQTEMNRLFNDNFYSPTMSILESSTPSVNVVENDKTFKVKAELPGIDEKDIDISISDSSLTIKGEKSEEKEDEKDNYVLKECSYGSFQRSFLLPSSVNTDKAEASFKKGVLTITIPKKEEAVKKIKNIKVKQGK